MLSNEYSKNNETCDDNRGSVWGASSCCVKLYNLRHVTFVGSVRVHRASSLVDHSFLTKGLLLLSLHSLHGSVSLRFLRCLSCLFRWASEFVFTVHIMYVDICVYYRVYNQEKCRCSTCMWRRFTKCVDNVFEIEKRNTHRWHFVSFVV